jgi:hypothetical protein
VCHLRAVHDGYADRMHKGVPHIDTDPNSGFPIGDIVAILQFLAEGKYRTSKCPELLHFPWDILPGKHHMRWLLSVDVDGCIVEGPCVMHHE